jgi:hypothetical protein
MHRAEEDDFATRMRKLQHDIEAAGGNVGNVEIIAVSKMQSIASIISALQFGVIDFGENYAQELLQKAEALDQFGIKQPRWHFIGHLQSNKVKALAPFVHLWQSVDRASIIDEIARHAPGGRVLIQVNESEEAQKSGCEPAEAPGLIDRARAAGLRVEGLMTMGVEGDRAATRAAFARLAQLAQDLRVSTVSMGMSDDFDLAVEEGATMIRVGSGLFGARPHAAR